jgi:hypothetical protein
LLIDVNDKKSILGLDCGRSESTRVRKGNLPGGLIIWSDEDAKSPWLSERVQHLLPLGFADPSRFGSNHSRPQSDMACDSISAFAAFDFGASGNRSFPDSWALSEPDTP